jgi:hypothetical protein
VGVSGGSTYSLRHGFWVDAAGSTVVFLARFEAWPEKKRTIHVQWETTEETENLGFDLYRSDTRDGPKTRLNKTLIPSKVPPGSPFGAVYDWIDRKPRSHQTYFYWLEDLDIYGHRKMQGPAEVTLP